MVCIDSRARVLGGSAPRSYVCGFPAWTLWFNNQHKEKIMEDQLLRAFDKGATRRDNPNLFQFRRAYNKLYYLFKPEYNTWITIIIIRKLALAGTGLMFRSNPSFQLAISLLITFFSFVLQVRFRPFLCEPENDSVRRAHDKLCLAGDPVRSRIDLTIRGVVSHKPKAGRTWGTSADESQSKAARTLLNYNTVEAVLLACAVIVNLSGLMFDSLKQQTADQNASIATENSAVAAVVIFIIVSSLLYFLFVLIVDVYSVLNPTSDPIAKMLSWWWSRLLCYCCFRALSSQKKRAAQRAALDDEDGDATGKVEMENPMAVRAPPRLRPRARVPRESACVCSRRARAAHPLAEGKQRWREQRVLQPARAAGGEGGGGQGEGLRDRRRDDRGGPACG